MSALDAIQQALMAGSVATVNAAPAVDPIEAALKGQLPEAAPDIPSNLNPVNPNGAKSDAIEPVGGRDFLAAFAHHIGKIPAALAQLGVHGYGKVTGDTAPAAAVDDFLKKEEAAYQGTIPTNGWSLGGAALGEVAPLVMTGAGRAIDAGGRMVGQGTEWLASKLPSSVASYAGNVANGVAQGAAYGALTPATGEGDFLSQKGSQAGFGAATGGVINGVAAPIVQTVADTVRPLVAPGSRAREIVREAFSKAAPEVDPAVAQAAQAQGAVPPASQAELIARLRGAQQLVPGSQPTAAQVGQSIPLLQLEYAARQTPEGMRAFAERGVQNNAARWAQINQFAGTEAQLAEAKAAREAATAPLFRDTVTPPAAPSYAETWGQRVMSGDMNAPMPGNPVPVKNVLSAVDDALHGGFTEGSVGGQSENPIVRKALGYIRDRVEAAAENGYIRPDILHGIRMNARDIVNQQAQEGRVAFAVHDTVSPTLDRIVGAIDAANPGYRRALDTYRELSAPVNTMELAGDLRANLSRSGLDALSNPIITLPAMRSQINLANKADFKMSPEAQGAFQNIEKDLQRQTISNSLPFGNSATAYNFGARGMVPKALLGAASSVPGVGKLVSSSQENINRELARLLMDPRALAAALEAGQNGAANVARNATTSAAASRAQALAQFLGQQ